MDTTDLPQLPAGQRWRKPMPTSQRRERRIFQRKLRKVGAGGARIALSDIKTLMEESRQEARNKATGRR